MIWQPPCSAQCYEITPEDQGHLRLPSRNRMGLPQRASHERGRDEQSGQALPEGRVTALIGTNGAGKTTLLHLLAGLSTPTTGQAAIMGGYRPGHGTMRDKVALVAQDAPVYGGMSVCDTLRAARGLNGCWDQSYAERRLAALGIPMKARD